MRSNAAGPGVLAYTMTGEDGTLRVVAFNTDVPHLRGLGKPLLFGPGSILDAHGANEKISKKELLAAVATYEEMVVSLLEGRVA